MDKKRLAKKMVEYFSRNLGLDALEVVFVEAMHFKNKHISATFNPDIYRISLNKDWLEDAPAIEIIRVAAHETRHAYQKACVDLSMYFKGREHRKSIDIWKQDFKSYRMPNADRSTEDEYTGQTIERDAEEFARRMTVKLAHQTQNNEEKIFVF